MPGLCCFLRVTHAQCSITHQKYTRTLCLRPITRTSVVWVAPKSNGDHLFDFGATAVACACSLCQERVFPSCPDFGSAPRAHADREHRWRHIEHLLFECPGILGTGGTLAVILLRDDLLRRVLGLIMHRRCCLQRFLLIVPLLWLPRLVSSRSSSTLLLHWDVLPLSRMKLQCLSLVAVLAWCVVCGVHEAASV